MKDSDWEQLRGSWTHLARAGEEFARRMAKDARKFAERVEVHVEDLAEDLRHEWSAAERRPEVRRVVEELRGVVGTVLDSVDDLVTDLFSAGAPASWSRRVCMRETACTGCGKALAPGTEAYIRGRGAAREQRCLECGVPKGTARG